MPKLKFCGLKSVNDIILINEYKPDYIGFVFAESRRKINREKALQMKSRLDKDILAVGVFVNESIDVISRLCHDGIIDLIQLHGDEDEDYIQALKKTTSNKIIKAIRIRHEKDIILLKNLSCDYLLFDTYSSHTSGGTGHRFDWSVLEEADTSKPYFLAGGINYQNISDAIRITPSPFCLDLSSGIEMNGVKDKQLIQDLMQNYNSSLHGLN